MYPFWDLHSFRVAICSADVSCHHTYFFRLVIVHDLLIVQVCPFCMSLFCFELSVITVLFQILVLQICFRSHYCRRIAPLTHPLAKTLSGSGISKHGNLSILLFSPRHPTDRPIFAYHAPGLESKWVALAFPRNAETEQFQFDVLLHSYFLEDFIYS